MLEDKLQEQLAEEHPAPEAASPEAVPPKPTFEPYEKASPRKRMLAWVGVVFMVLLVLLYTYSMASGNILKW